MKKGQVLPSNANKSRGWELSSVENDTYGIEGGNSAVFKIVKTTGNYYGSQFLSLIHICAELHAFRGHSGVTRP